MKFKELYNKIRREQKVSLDEGSMWDAIESRLEKPKKRRRFIWLWFTIGLLMVSSYVFLDQDLNSISNQNELNEKSSSKRAIPMNSQAVLPPSALDYNTQKTNDKGESIQPEASLAMSQSSGTIRELDHEIYVDTPAIKVGEKELEEKEPQNVKNQEKPIGKGPQVVLINQEVETSLNVSENLHDSYQKLIETDVTGSNIVSQFDSSYYNQEIRLSLPVNNLPVLSISKIMRDISTLRIAPILAAILEYESLESSKESSEKPTQDQVLEKIRKLEFAITLDYLQQRSRVAEKDPTLMTWALLHDQSKSASSSFQVSTILKYRFSSGLGLGTGVITRVVSEWYDATAETVSPYEVPSDSAKFVIVNGFQQYASGVLTGKIIERTNYHTPVRRLYFDVPLEVSYRRSWNKLDAEFSMSYNFNLSHQYYGRSYSESKILLSQNQLRSQAIYKNNFVNSINVGMKLNRQLTSNLSLGISLNYWRQLSSSLGINSTLNEHYVGLGGGVNVKTTFGH